MSKGKEILAHLAQGESQRHIAAALHVSRNTVAKVAAAAKHLSLSPADWKELSESELHQKLFPASASELVPVMPDFCYIHRELLRSGVTLKLLWEEYVDSCRQSHQLYFRYSQFCKRYRDHVEQNNLTMHIRHNPGDREYDIRRNNHLQRLLKNATLVYPNAMLRNIEYLPDRHLNRDLLKHLESNEYIQHHANIVIIGATGSGAADLARGHGTSC